VEPHKDEKTSPSDAEKDATNSEQSRSVALQRFEVEGDDGDPPLTALPSYVLLVGLGVCSLVMRVVFKRIVGRTI